MIFLYIYLGISALNLILGFLAIMKLWSDIRAQHPEMDTSTTTSVSTIFGILLHVLRLIIMCWVPILNIMILYDLVFKYQAFEKYVLDRFNADYDSDKL